MGKPNFFVLPLCSGESVQGRDWTIDHWRDIYLWPASFKGKKSNDFFQASDIKWLEALLTLPFIYFTFFIIIDPLAWRAIIFYQFSINLIEFFELFAVITKALLNYTFFQFRWFFCCIFSHGVYSSFIVSFFSLNVFSE